MNKTISFEGEIQYKSKPKRFIRRKEYDLEEVKLISDVYLYDCDLNIFGIYMQYLKSSESKPMWRVYPWLQTSDGDLNLTKYFYKNYNDNPISRPSDYKIDFKHRIIIISGYSFQVATKLRKIRDEPLISDIMIRFTEKGFNKFLKLYRSYVQDCIDHKK